MELRRQVLRASHARAIVDATHPYAQQMSEQLIELGRELGVPYVRYERPRHLGRKNALWCATRSKTPRSGPFRTGQAYLSGDGLEGSGDSSCKRQARSSASGSCVSPRAGADPACHRVGYSAGSSSLRCRGHFPRSSISRLWRDQRIDCVVTKDSGEAGGFSARPARRRGWVFRCWSSRRPQIAYPRVATDFDVCQGGVASGWDCNALMEGGLVRRPIPVTVVSGFLGPGRRRCCATCCNIARSDGWLC